MKNLYTFSELFDQYDYFITFDLSSGYHHVDIHLEYKKYLGFHWTYSNGIRYFIFNVLPFGLNSVCFVFTKLLRPFTKKWRGEGIKSVIFIDDGICGSSFEFTKEIATLMLSDLRNAGWLVNFEKKLFDTLTRG